VIRWKRESDRRYALYVDRLPAAQLGKIGRATWRNPVSRFSYSSLANATVDSEVDVFWQHRKRQQTLRDHLLGLTRNAHIGLDILLEENGCGAVPLSLGKTAQQLCRHFFALLRYKVHADQVLCQLVVDALLQPDLLGVLADYLADKQDPVERDVRELMQFAQLCQIATIPVEEMAT
jgi:hypothetical protein